MRKRRDRQRFHSSTVHGDGTADCGLCGHRVPLGDRGRCVLGHRLGLLDTPEPESHAATSNAFAVPEEPALIPAAALIAELGAAPAAAGPSSVSTVPAPEPSLAYDNAVESLVPAELGDGAAPDARSAIDDLLSWDEPPTSPSALDIEQAGVGGPAAGIRGQGPIR